MNTLGHTFVQGLKVASCRTRELQVEHRIHLDGPGPRNNASLSGPFDHCSLAAVCFLERKEQLTLCSNEHYRRRKLSSPEERLWVHWDLEVDDEERGHSCTDMLGEEGVIDEVWELEPCGHVAQRAVREDAVSPNDFEHGFLGRYLGAQEGQWLSASQAAVRCPLLTLPIH